MSSIGLITRENNADAKPPLFSCGAFAGGGVLGLVVDGGAYTGPVGVLMFGAGVLMFGAVGDLYDGSFFAASIVGPCVGARSFF